MTQGYQLPADTRSFSNQKATGFATPQQDKAPQTATFLPRRVIPVIFLPGIMGSNLRITDPARQRQLGQADNIAWRPDDLSITNVGASANASARDRQLRLDPATTAVDLYEPGGGNVSGDGRHGNVSLDGSAVSPLLADDPPGKRDRRTASQKARARGWGEVYFKSYGQLLQHLESHLNNTFWDGKVRDAWKNVVGVDPKRWGANVGVVPGEATPQHALTEDELKKVATGCWFPVYAFGYNWLQSNAMNAKTIALRITAVIDTFSKASFECDKVIVVTHSMGGILGRALVHPDYGNLQDKVLGIVHGVQPAIGAAAAYKRMRAGFEDTAPWYDNKSVQVLGHVGDNVTAVLANAPGGLELLPTQAYGNGWLQVTHNGQPLAAWPKNGDPYEEIYKVRGKWWSLFREEWINPSDLPEDRGGGAFARTVRYLDQAKKFHNAIANTYHDCSFAHYGADRSHPSFGQVIWNLETKHDVKLWESLEIRSDTRQGRLTMGLPTEKEAAFTATIANATEPGDGTVPERSSDHQLHSHKFKGVFRQNGYDHQGSYQNANVLACTLYSIVRIAQQAKWKE